MRQLLLDLLICPRCLPAEKPLRAAVRKQSGEEILAGTLSCPACRTDYPISDGIAAVVPEQPDFDRYATAERLVTYLWSHYADLEGDADAHDAYPAWRELLGDTRGAALDTGCAVGRLSFELARSAELVVGIDLSAGFVRAARTLARDGVLTYRVIDEGELGSLRTIHLPAELPRQRVDFLQADALALPFPAGTFTTVTSLNLFDRVPAPRRHLAELDRVAARDAATLLAADPWSWGQSPAMPENWLGGRVLGRNCGASKDNLRSLMEKSCRPPWRIAASGRIDWTLRNHRNHFELIRSDYLLARR